MALLKQEARNSVSEFTSWSFHDWIIMALLKPDGLQGMRISRPCFHDWIIMALLKHPSNSIVRSVLHCFHDWIIMALLKLRVGEWRDISSEVFPWLNNHGSIEAIPRNFFPTSTILFPWLNNHGSIEAPQCESGFRDPSGVSMIE